VENKYWPRESRANKTFTRSGSDNSDLNNYTYNEIGFRGNSIEEPIDMLAIGCSHTEGIGVNDNETWPYYLAENCGWNHINMGYTGRSNDYISRMTLTYLKEFNPKFLFVMYTYTSRREYFTEYGYQPWHPTPWGYFEDNYEKYKAFATLNTIEADIENYKKNKKIVELACKENYTQLIWNGSFVNDNPIDFESNRYDGDYNIKYGMHATAEENKKYSSKLVGFLKDNSYI
tara:strand:- start:47 stop:739 length:693 start_codon:yes stop_codon:yes gene_type:complete